MAGAVMKICEHFLAWSHFFLDNYYGQNYSSSLEKLIDYATEFSTSACIPPYCLTECYLTSIAGLIYVNDLDLMTQIFVSPCHTYMQ